MIFEWLAILFALGLLFVLQAIFPRAGFQLARLWVRSEDGSSDIAPTRLYVVWTRVAAIVCALALFAVAGALIVKDRAETQDKSDCVDLLSTVHQRIFVDGEFFGDEVDAIGSELGVRLETTYGVLDDEFYASVTVHHEDFRAHLQEDTDIVAYCERLA
ncbi:MAG: hypothetical protein ACTHXA_05495 [Gulosibacter sp.]|uniref:hypothetical protein n=1 Tax=Gulosibacter sp. TaxID=2817531 RepID=UPI003F909EC5